MIGTEQAAREWWCPMVRAVAWPDGPPVNRGMVDGKPFLGHCIASKCALWRWSTGAAEPNRRGYCGLGGSQ